MTAEPRRLPDRHPVPQPPKHLATASRALWRAILAEYALEAHHLAVLLVTCEAKDRMDEARAAIAADGPYVAGLHGPRAHPAITVERDSRTAFLRGLRELGLDLESPAAPRPPSRWRS